MKGLRIALSITPGDKALDEDAIPYETYLIAACAGLVVNDQESNTVRLVHYTTQEYFKLSRTRCFPTAHASITKACLAYLSFGVFAGEANWEILRSMEPHNSLFEYSILYWWESMPMKRRMTTNSLILTFFREDFWNSSVIQQATICLVLWKESWKWWRRGSKRRYLRKRSISLPHMSALHALDLTVTIALLFKLDSIAWVLFHDGARVNVGQGVRYSH